MLNTSSVYLYTNGGFYGWLSVCPKFFEKEIVRDRDDMKETLTEREREGYGETEAPVESNQRRRKIK